MRDRTRWHSSARAILSLVAAAACTEAELLVPPVPEDAQSALVLSPSRPAFAHAKELGAAGLARVELPERTDEAPLFVSLFGCSLDDLALAAGEVPLRVGSGRGFPEGARNLRFDPEGEGAWTSIDGGTLRQALEPLRLDEDEAPPCNDFPILSPAQEHIVPGVAGHLSLVALDDEVGLLATAVSLHWVRPDLSLEVVEHPLLQTSTAAIVPGEPGEVIIIPLHGPMLRGHPDLGLEVHGPGPPNATNLMHVARNPPEADEVEIFVYGELGLSRFDGVRWTMLDPTPQPFEKFVNPRGLWVGANEVVFLPTDPERMPRILHWRNDTFVEIPMPDIPRSLAPFRGRSILVGSEGGLVFEVDLEAQAVETRLSGWSRPMRPIWVILPLEESFLLSGWSGLSNELFPSGEFCSFSGFTPDIRGASMGAATLFGPRREILAAGGSGRSGETTTRLSVFRLGRSSAKPARCPSELDE